MEIWQKWMHKLQTGKGVKIACVLGAVGVLCICLSEWLPQKKQENAEQEMVTADRYCEQVENRLSYLLGKMDGVGTCQVYVTLESGVEYVYATAQKENADYVKDSNQNGEKVSERADTEQDVILIDGTDGKTGLLLTEIQPTVKGVVVVCDGGDREDVVQRVTSAVTTALNISARRVCVTK
ncbi:MAG: hypothetical protein J6L00_00065 [Clostridia bacterium]|nr:hypothetical protein [Clostridia bacterium]